jgi:heat shock protein 1/8
MLSSSLQASINLNSLHDDINFNLSISRDQFEQLNDDLFQSLIRLIEKALHDAKTDKSSIHDILLIGGSTRIPKIQQLLQDFFNGKQLNKSFISVS